MPKCYFCGIEFSELKICPLCKQSYCEQHFPTNLHDCPLVPIQNPYEQNINAGNILVTPEELASQPIIPPNNIENSYQQQSVPQYSANFQQSTPVSSQTSSYDSEDYVYTDGTYFWHRKDQVEDLDSIDAFDPSSGIVIPGLLWPKKSELFHVVFASILLLLLVGSGIITNTFIQLYSQAKQYGIPLELLLQSVDIKELLLQSLIMSLFYLSAFLGHEFSHRQTAKHFKLQTKFRLFKMGVIMTVICLFLPIKFALPGAVVVIGLEEISRRTGLCKLAGPLSNLIMGSILILIAILPFTPSPWNYWLILGSSFNFSLGAFNMIPVGILDGDNIRKWKPKVWLLMIVALILLFLLSVYLQNIFTPT
ncbi:MAG: hypothetical protein ACTSRZ_09275 [Promethearchaeota archaeon]